MQAQRHANRVPVGEHVKCRVELCRRQYGNYIEINLFALLYQTGRGAKLPAVTSLTQIFHLYNNSHILSMCVCERARQCRRQCRAYGCVRFCAIARACGRLGGGRGQGVGGQHYCVWWCRVCVCVFTFEYVHTAVAYLID